jgi:hypothetical protein
MRAAPPRPPVNVLYELLLQKSSLAAVTSPVPNRAMNGLWFGFFVLTFFHEILALKDFVDPCCLQARSWTPRSACGSWSAS